MPPYKPRTDGIEKGTLLVTWGANDKPSAKFYNTQDEAMVDWKKTRMGKGNWECYLHNSAGKKLKSKSNWMILKKGGWPKRNLNVKVPVYSNSKYGDDWADSD